MTPMLPASFFLRPAIFLCMALASPIQQRPAGRAHYIRCPRSKPAANSWPWNP